MSICWAENIREYIDKFFYCIRFTASYIDNPSWMSNCKISKKERLDEIIDIYKFSFFVDIMELEWSTIEEVLEHKWYNPIRVTRAIDRKESIDCDWEFFVLSLIHSIDTPDRLRKSIFTKRFNGHILMNWFITRTILIYRREVDKCFACSRV